MRTLWTGLIGLGMLGMVACSDDPQTIIKTEYEVITVTEQVVVTVTETEVVTVEVPVTEVVEVPKEGCAPLRAHPTPGGL